jgi:hypothetical protein
MIISGLGIFLAGLISLLDTRRFLRKAVSAKGRVSDICEIIPAWTSDSHSVSLDEVAAGFVAMDQRRAMKVMVRP